MNELITKLKENKLIDSMGNIILEKTEQQTQVVDIVTFNIFFGDKPPTYENLIGTHTFVWNGETLTRSAEELGYKKYFDQWKELGII